MPEEKKSNNGKLGLIAVLGLIALIFILLNSQEVEIKFILGTTTAPLIFALAISTVLGFAIGYFMGRFSDHGKKD